MRKENNTYYFSVEGETEKWYLEWLQSAINRCNEAQKTVKIVCRVESDPVSYVKRMNPLGKTDVTHVFDFESIEPEYENRFKGTLEKMKKAEKLGKNIKYHLGYSNLTFELWMILHKTACNGSLADRKQYLTHLNRAYGESFEKLSDYKKENEFKRILAKLGLKEVFDAIERAKKIEKRNQEDGAPSIKHSGYEYHRENPSLSIWESIEKILKDCRIDPTMLEQ